MSINSFNPEISSPRANGEGEMEWMEDAVPDYNVVNGALLPYTLHTTLVENTQKEHHPQNGDNVTDRSTGVTSFCPSSRSTSVANSMGNLSSLADMGRAHDDSDNCSILSSGCSTIIGLPFGRRNAAPRPVAPIKKSSMVATRIVAPPSSPNHASTVGADAFSFSNTAPHRYSSSTIRPSSGILSLPARLNSEMCTWSLDACDLHHDQLVETETQGDEDRLDERGIIPDALLEDEFGREDMSDGDSDGSADSIGTSLAVEVASLDDEGTYVGYGEEARGGKGEGDGDEQSLYRDCSDLDDCDYYLHDLPPSEPGSSKDMAPVLDQPNAQEWEEAGTVFYEHVGDGSELHTLPRAVERLSPRSYTPPVLRPVRRRQSTNSPVMMDDTRCTAPGYNAAAFSTDRLSEIEMNNGGSMPPGKYIHSNTSSTGLSRSALREGSFPSGAGGSHSGGSNSERSGGGRGSSQRRARAGKVRRRSPSYLQQQQQYSAVRSDLADSAMQDDISAGHGKRKRSDGAGMPQEGGSGRLYYSTPPDKRPTLRVT